MKELPKATRRLIRQWSEIAYERELGAELGQLHDLFHQWEARAINPFDLSDAIHKFHDGPARELYGRYVMSRGHDDWLVAAAIARGILTREELPAPLLDSLNANVEMCQEE